MCLDDTCLGDAHQCEQGAETIPEPSTVALNGRSAVL